MLRRIRVGQRLIAGFALLILAVLAAAAVGTWKMSAMKDRADYIAGTPLQAVQVLSVTNKAVAHHRLQQWALVTSTDPSERAAILK